MNNRKLKKQRDLENAKILEQALRTRILNLLEGAGPKGMSMLDLFTKMPSKTPKGLFYRLTYRMTEEGVLQRVRWGVIRAACDVPIPSPVVRKRVTIDSAQTNILQGRILGILKAAGPEGVHRSVIREHLGPDIEATLISRAIRALVEDGKAMEPRWKWVVYCEAPAPLTLKVLPFTSKNVQDHARDHGVVPDTNPGNLPDIPVAWWLLEDAAGTKRAALVGAEDDLISVWTPAYGWVEVDDVVVAIPLPRHLGE